MSIKTSDLPLNERLEKELADKFMRTSIARAQDLLNQKRADAFEELGNYEQWRENAAAVRSHVLENLDYYLNQFVDKATSVDQHGAWACARSWATDQPRPCRSSIMGRPSKGPRGCPPASSRRGARTPSGAVRRSG